MKTPLLRFLFILLLSLCLHLVLLLMSTGDAVHMADKDEHAHAASLQVRLLPSLAEEAGTHEAASAIDTVKPAESTPAPAAPEIVKSAPVTESANQPSAALALPTPERDTPTYYPSQFLGEKPRILEDPLYATAQALPSAAAGHLVLRLYISQVGTMDDVVVEKSNVNAVFLPQIKRAAMGMRFAPGRISGKAVGTEMRIELEIGRSRPWP